MLFEVIKCLSENISVTFSNWHFGRTWLPIQKLSHGTDRREDPASIWLDPPMLSLSDYFHTASVHALEWVEPARRLRGDQLKLFHCHKGMDFPSESTRLETWQLRRLFYGKILPSPSRLDVLSFLVSRATNKQNLLNFGQNFKWVLTHDFFIYSVPDSGKAWHSFVVCLDAASSCIHRCGPQPRHHFLDTSDLGHRISLPNISESQHWKTVLIV